jgi:GH25 family lysozyme M1 (1,4-beta-N-acetylmuramidase)
MKKGGFYGHSQTGGKERCYMPPITKHRSLSMTYVEELVLAEILFGIPVRDPQELLFRAQATPFLPDFEREEEWVIDTSVYNGTADGWRIKGFYRKDERYKNYVKAWITRAGQSWGYEDPTFEYNWNVCDYVGIPKMAYWVIFPSQPIDEQIRKLMDTFTRVDRGFGDGPLWIDYELHHNMSPGPLQDRLWEFYTKLKSETGHTIGVYTGNWFLQAYCQPLRDWWAEIDHMWLAHYFNPEIGHEVTFPPDKPDIIPWEHVDLHQNQSHYDFVEVGFLGDGILRGDGNRYIHPSRPFSEFITQEGNVSTYKAYMRNDAGYTDVTDRFSKLEGTIVNGELIFNFVTLADKMSMQGGRLYIAPTNVPAEGDYATPQGSITVESPRKPDFPQRSGIVVWAYGPGNVPSLIFTVEGEAMTGNAQTSDDVPWNWHYGFDIKGSIDVPTETDPPDPDPDPEPDPEEYTDAEIGRAFRILTDTFWGLQK